MGRHSRWDAVQFGDTWQGYIESGKRFPSNAQAGLGRRFAWNQLAVENGIVNLQGEFTGDPAVCLARAEELRNTDNALDSRMTCSI